MLSEIGSVENVRYLEDRLHRKAKIMGFGHRVYKVKDPRATILQDLAQKLFEVWSTTSIEHCRGDGTGDRGKLAQKEFIRMSAFIPV